MIRRKLRQAFSAGLYVSIYAICVLLDKRADRNVQAAEDELEDVKERNEITKLLTARARARLNKNFAYRPSTEDNIH